MLEVPITSQTRYGCVPFLNIQHHHILKVKLFTGQKIKAYSYSGESSGGQAANV